MQCRGAPALKAQGWGSGLRGVEGNPRLTSYPLEPPLGASSHDPQAVLGRKAEWTGGK